MRTALNTTISPLPGGRGTPGTPRFRLRPARRDLRGATTCFCPERRDLGTSQSCFCPARCDLGNATILLLPGRRDLGDATILLLPGEARRRERHNPASARRGATSARHNPASARRGATSGTPQSCFCPARRDLGNAQSCFCPEGVGASLLAIWREAAVNRSTLWCQVYRACRVCCRRPRRSLARWSATLAAPTACGQQQRHRRTTE